MSYPIILIPSRLIDIKENGYWPSEPVEPKQPQVYEKGCFSIITMTVFWFTLIPLLMGSLPALIMDSGDMQDAFIPLLLVVIVSGVFSFFIRENEKESEETIMKYQKEYENYQKRLAEYKSELLIISQMTFTENREYGLLRYYRIWFKPNYYQNTYKKGYAEKLLQDKLSYYFDDKILVDYTIPNMGANNTRSYLPDVIYYNPKSGICIDIEIDELYAQDTMSPIHYKGLKSDSDRNNFFNTNGWLVIRFSEKQVLENIMGCIGEVYDVISIYDPHFEEHPELSSIELIPLPPERQKSYSEIDKLIRDNRC